MNDCLTAQTSGMKKYLFSLFALILAIYFSAFTKIKSSFLKNRLNNFYGLNSTGDNYIAITTTLDLNNCHGHSTYYCVLGYEVPQTSPFNVNNIPPGSIPIGEAHSIYFSTDD